MISLFSSEHLEIKLEDVLCVLRPLYDRIISLDPRNIPWLKNRADIFLGETFFAFAQFVLTI